MNTFPAISRHPSIQGYGETRSGDSVIMGSTESGYPTINKLFTFDPNIWSFTLEGVSQADKESVEAFYEANKDVPFY